MRTKYKAHLLEVFTGDQSSSSCTFSQARVYRIKQRMMEAHGMRPFFFTLLIYGLSFVTPSTNEYVHTYWNGRLSFNGV